jgi:ABC-type protease/lipase transport system fused ATPase/permease subunit
VPVMQGFIIATIAMNASSAGLAIVIVCLLPFLVNMLLGIHSLFLVNLYDEEKQARQNEAI